jgi:hypothetical protein
MKDADELEAEAEEHQAISEREACLADAARGLAAAKRHYDEVLATNGREVSLPALSAGIDGARVVLSGAPGRDWSASEVRDELAARGVAFTSRNPVATITAALHRLVARGVVHQVARGRFQWGPEKSNEEKE